MSQNGLVPSNLRFKVQYTNSNRPKPENSRQLFYLAPKAFVNQWPTGRGMRFW